MSADQRNVVNLCLKSEIPLARLTLSGTAFQSSISKAH